MTDERGGSSPSAPGKTGLAAAREAVERIAGALWSPAVPGDGALTIRILGEFSAGKTRVLRELLGDRIPEALAPVSSPEVQTLLPLEVTHGAEPRLVLVEKGASDYVPAREVREYRAFPRREDLAGIDPATHRLRLTVDEPNLTLEHGDGQVPSSGGPSRIFLTDMPGWNADEDPTAENMNLSEDWCNLALVYVCQGNRVDSLHNRRCLEVLAGAMRDVLIMAQPRLPLAVVVTACPPEERPSAAERIGRMIGELTGNDPDIPVCVFCVDFATMEEGGLARFRRDFWKTVLSEAPCGPMAPVLVPEARTWPPEYDMSRQLHADSGAVRRMHDLLVHACRFGTAGGALNRLADLTPEQQREKVLVWWHRALGLPDRGQVRARERAAFPEEHPFAAWDRSWRTPCLDRLTGAFNGFFRTAEETIHSIDFEPLVESRMQLSDLLRGHLAARLEHALEAFTAPCVQFWLEAEACPETMHPLRFAATVFRLSLFAARFEETGGAYRHLLGLSEKPIQLSAPVRGEDPVMESLYSLADEERLNHYLDSMAGLQEMQRAELAGLRRKLQERDRQLARYDRRFRGGWLDRLYDVLDRMERRRMSAGKEAPAAAAESEAASAAAPRAAKEKKAGGEQEGN